MDSLLENFNKYSRIIFGFGPIQQRSELFTCTNLEDHAKQMEYNYYAALFRAKASQESEEIIDYPFFEGNNLDFTEPIVTFSGRRKEMIRQNIELLFEKLPHMMICRSTQDELPTRTSPDKTNDNESNADVGYGDTETVTPDSTNDNKRNADLENVNMEITNRMNSDNNTDNALVFDTNNISGSTLCDMVVMNKDVAAIPLGSFIQRLVQRTHVPYNPRKKRNEAARARMAEAAEHDSLKTVSQSVFPNAAVFSSESPNYNLTFEPFDAIADINKSAANLMTRKDSKSLTDILNESLEMNANKDKPGPSKPLMTLEDSRSVTEIFNESLAANSNKCKLGQSACLQTREDSSRLTDILNESLEVNANKDKSGLSKTIKTRKNSKRLTDAINECLDVTANKDKPGPSKTLKTRECTRVQSDNLNESRNATADIKISGTTKTPQMHEENKGQTDKNESLKVTSGIDKPGPSKTIKIIQDIRGQADIEKILKHHRKISKEISFLDNTIDVHTIEMNSAQSTATATGTCLIYKTNDKNKRQKKPKKVCPEALKPPKIASESDKLPKPNNLKNERKINTKKVVNKRNASLTISHDEDEIIKKNQNATPKTGEKVVQKKKKK